VRRVARAPAWAVAALLAALYLLIDPPSADLAAQTYRTWLFEHTGFTVWDGGWYGGHHVPAYSILFPPLAALLGPRVVGALAAVVAAWAFERAVRGPGARAAALWFATATAIALVTGRLTFALGLAIGVLALWALIEERLAWCAVAGVAATLASPVAGAFLAPAIVAWGVTARRTRAAAALIAITLAPAAALSLAFPEGGDFPFEADAFWPTLAATLLVLAVVWRSAPRALRLGLVLYVVLLIASAALSTPMGGNAVRLGATFAGPIAALALWPDRRRALLLLAPILVYWQWTTPADDWWRARSDASIHAGYYTGLLRFLEARERTESPFRIEIPFTDNHWESARVASHVPLARGWERQLDRKVNALFYDDRPLTAGRYRRWLDANAVRYVALADAPVDYSAAHEAALVRAGTPYLTPVWHDAHWRVFAVRNATPIASGARLQRLDPDRLVLDAEKPGRVTLRVRWTPYWRLQEGRGCVVKEGEWTALDLRAPGRVQLRTDFAPGRIRATASRCTS
jgi:hypothetical protein